MSIINTLNKLLVILPGLLLMTISVYSQDTTALSGRVTNKAGEPLGLTSIIIEDLKIGTLVQGDGTYFLAIPAQRELTNNKIEVSVSRIGYKNQNHTLTLDAGKILEKNFVLEQQPKLLDTVVVNDNVGPAFSEKNIWINNKKDTLIFNVNNNFYSSIIERPGKPKVTYKGLYSVTNGKAALFFEEGHAYANIKDDKMRITYYDANDKIIGTYELKRAR